MESIRQWWLSALKDVLEALAKAWRFVASGIGEDWNVRGFILLMAFIVIIAGIATWRRRA